MTPWTPQHFIIEAPVRAGNISKSPYHAIRLDAATDLIDEAKLREVEPSTSSSSAMPAVQVVMGPGIPKTTEQR